MPQIGLSGYQESELLGALEAKAISIFITIDGNIEYQQQFRDRSFGTVIIRAASNRFQDLQPLSATLASAVKTTTAGGIIRIP